MRIAHIVGSFGDGKCGVGDFAFHLSSGMARLLNSEQGESGVFVLTAGSTEAAAQRHNLKLLQTEIPGFKCLAPRLYAYGGMDFSMVRAAPAASALFAVSPDAVLIQYPSKGYGWTLGSALGIPHTVRSLGKRLGREIPVIAVIHEYKDAHPLRKRVTAALARSADGVITPCELEGKMLARLSGKNPSVIPDGDVFAQEIDQSEFHNLSVLLHRAKPGKDRATILMNFGESSIRRREMEANAAPASLAKAMEGDGVNQQRFFTYGHLARSKEPEVLLEAFRYVFKEHPGCQLVIASNFDGAGEYRAKFRSKIASLGLSANVIVTGALPAIVLKAVAGKCAAQVYTFRNGFTGKRSSAISALSLDCPMIVSKSSEYPETPLIEVSPGSPDELAEVILRIANMRAEEFLMWRLAQLDKQAQFREQFDFGAIAARYLDQIRAFL